jgi:hypothetical protein
MSQEEKVNAISRLIILLTLIGYLFTQSHKIFYLGLITLAIIYVLYYSQNKGKPKKNEGFSNKLSEVYPLLTNPMTYNLNKQDYTKPTPTNPLMNVLIPEIYYDPKRKPAAPAFDPEVEKDINKSVKAFVGKSFNDPSLTKKLFADLGEEMMFDRSMLQWSAKPSTEIPNDRATFQEYLYGDMISGKEGNPFALERHNSGAFNYTLR